MNWNYFKMVASDQNMTLKSFQDILGLAVNQFDFRWFLLLWQTLPAPLPINNNKKISKNKNHTHLQHKQENSNCLLYLREIIIF